jgi:hypothetical protein
MTTSAHGHRPTRSGPRRLLLAVAAGGVAAASLATVLVAAGGPAGAATPASLSPGIAGHAWRLSLIQDPGQNAAPGAPAVLTVPRTGPVILGTGCSTVPRKLTIPAPHQFALTGGRPINAMCTRQGQQVQDVVLTAFSGPVSYSLRRDGTLRVTGHGETLIYRRA